LALAVALLLSAPSASWVGAQTQPDDKDQGVPISLDEALHTALENNLDLVIVKRDPKIADLGVDVEEGVFDPSVNAVASYAKTDTDTDSTNRLLDATASGTSGDETLTLNPYLEQNLKFGGLYRVGYVWSEFKGDANGFNQVNFFQSSKFDQKTSGPQLHFEMPLLLGFGKEVRTLNLLLARSNTGISRQQLELQADTTIKAVEDAYWDVLAARRAVDVADQSLKLAKDLYDLNKKKVDVGTLAPIEITQAEAGVASRQEGVITARVLLENVEDELRRLMALPKDDPRWSQHLIPTDRPSTGEKPVDLAATLETAMRERPEIQTARQQLLDDELRERVAKKGVRHELDLNVDVNPVGIFHRTDVGVSGTGVLATPFDQLSDNTSLFWQVGLFYRYPIGNRTAKANSAIASLTREKSELAVQNIEQTVRVDVRTAVRNVESGAERITAAHSNTVLQQKTVEAEQKKLENGMSTSFEVLRIQTDLSDAQLAEIRAVLDYNKALADLERAKGTLLEARGLTLEETEESTEQ
jgi:outer membrane protein TolC